MSCRDCIDAASTPAGELTLGGRFSRWFHRTICPPCRAYFKGIAATERALRALAPEDPAEPSGDGAGTNAPEAREADLVAALRARKRDT